MDTSGSPIDFSYHRAVAPMLWVLILIGSVELVVTHLILSFWFPFAALLLSLVTAAGLGWLMWSVLQFRRLPVRLDKGRLTLRAGWIKGVTVPIGSVAGLRDTWDAALVKDRSTLNLALIAWPNVVVELAEPVTLGRRRIDRIAHRLDDPAGFAAALERLGAVA